MIGDPSGFHPLLPPGTYEKNDLRRLFTLAGRTTEAALRNLFFIVRSGGMKSRHSVIRRYFCTRPFVGED